MCENDDVDTTIVVVTAVVASDDDIDNDEVFDNVVNMVLLIEQDVIGTNLKYESIILLLLS